MPIIEHEYSIEFANVVEYKTIGLSRRNGQRKLSVLINKDYI